MKIARKFNQLTFAEYIFYIDNFKKYTDFNTLGLYRSIIENDKLDLENKIKVREYAHKIFKKSFDFLQLKDPKTFMEVSNLGIVLTEGDHQKIWNDIVANQKRILSDKKIKHRNFGDYSKHNCGEENCVWNGVMIRQGSWLAESSIHFLDDQNKYLQRIKSDKRKIDRKNKQLIIQREFDNK